MLMRIKMCGCVKPVTLAGRPLPNGIDFELVSIDRPISEIYLKAQWQIIATVLLPDVGSCRGVG